MISLRKLSVLLLLSPLYMSPAWADTTLKLFSVDKAGIGEEIGEVTIEESRYGLVFTPDLKNLPPGLRGFHVHENPSCQPDQEADHVAAGAAGGHYDPYDADHHGTPWGEGHLGDLPALYVNEKGHANHPVLAPRLTMQHVNGRALMIHEGSDNYADEPEPMGGGGTRIACGVITIAEE